MVLAEGKVEQEMATTIVIQNKNMKIKTIKPFKVLSLFDGISCARVALKRAKIPVEAYYASEIDSFAIQVSQKNFPDIIPIGDVKNIRKTMYRTYQSGDTENPRISLMSPDLLIGGSPCQDLSIAKKNRKGLDGDRSGLFWEYVRILKEVKPKYFILENVASMPKEAKELISKTLGVEPIMINAALVSAQNRKRLFWTNIPGVILPKDKEIFLRDILQPENEVDKKYYISDETLKKILQKMIEGKPIAQAFRIRDVAGKSVALSALGGGSGAKTGLYVINSNGTEQKKSKTIRTSGRGSGFGDKHNWDTIFVVPEATKKGFAIAKDGDGIDFSYPTSKTRRGRVGNKAKNLMTSQNISVFKNGKVRRLTPIECCRLQGLPDNHTARGGVSDSQAYKCLGNAFNADVIAHILSFIKK